MGLGVILEGRLNTLKGYKRDNSGNHMSNSVIR